MMDQVWEINTDHMKQPKEGADLFLNRTAVAEIQQTDGPAEVSIILQAYNRLEKTKRCVESVLHCTTDVNYELILIDNGSEDGTLEFFRSVPHSKKIIHITKNLGAAYPMSQIKLTDLKKYICILANDIIVTPFWLKNLLVCMRSDPRIGMVNPMCSNTSNLQCVELSYSDDTEMQEKAKHFNRSDPRKWEDRQRLITLGTVFRKEALMSIGWPVADVGFFHDFADDDCTFRIRRMGYRTVLAGDTWVCHDHDFRKGEGKDLNQFQRSVETGKRNFQEKFFGIDAWDDVNNYYIPYTQYFPVPKATKHIHVLGVDVRCGAPILDVKNWLRKAGIFDTELSAFVQDPKYWLDLKTICQGAVVCDREEFLTDSFPREYFDYVIADRPVNRYHEPQKLLNDLFSVCKRGGSVICKLRNAFPFQSYLYSLGQWEVYDREFSYNIPPEALQASLERFGTVKNIIAIPWELPPDQQQALWELLPKDQMAGQEDDVFGRMLCKEYMLIAEKNA